MTALAAQRKIEGNLIDGLLLPFEGDCAGSMTFYKGGLVGYNAAGYLVPALTTNSVLRVVGIVDLGQNAKVVTVTDGDTKVKFQVGVWPFKNSSSTDQITRTEMWKPVYAADDQTAAKTNGTGKRPVLGTLVHIEGGLLYVAVGFPFGFDSQTAGVAATVVTSGAVPVGGFTKLSVTGTVVFTLADGLYIGQRKAVRCTVAASTPVGSMTYTGGSISAIDAVGDFAQLEWNGSAWEVIASAGVTVT